MKISFDLDDVLFVSPKDYETEPPLRFPLSRLFPERLRKGTVQLIHDLQGEGFEVWVYTSSFRADVYIRSLFRHYGVSFDGIINGARHKREIQGNNPKPLPQKMPHQYHISLHIDDEDAVHANGKVYGFRTLKVFEPDPEWADKVMAEAKRIRDLEERAAEIRKQKREEQG